MSTYHDDAANVGEKPTSHKPAERVRLEEALEIATDAYIYAFPLVLMDVTRRVSTNVEKPTALMRAPANQFAHAREFGAQGLTGAVRPSADTLCSSIWLDLTREPIVVTVPDSRGRYYALPILDLWTNVFAVPGSRTTGTREQTFALVGPEWRGTLPRGIDEIRSPTTHAWLFGHTQAGRSDYEAVHRFQDGLVATPLSLSRSFAKPPVGRVNPDIDMKPPLDQVLRMGGAAFFTAFLHATKTDRPHIEDGPILARMKRIGLEPGKKVDFESLPLSIKAAIHDAPKNAQQRIAHLPNRGRLANGWSIPASPIGTYGTDYAKRAAIAYLGVGADTIDDAIHITCDERTSKSTLDSGAAYVMHFEPQEIPPAKAFWSLTLYNQRHAFAANKIDRHTISSLDPVKLNDNGSLDIYIQRDDPGAHKTANWLPTPVQGSFNLSLRLYWPKTSALDGTWSPPPLMRMK